MNTDARRILVSAFRAARQIDPDVPDDIGVILNVKPHMSPESLLLTQSETAKALNCSRWTVRNCVRDGTLKPISIRGLKRFRRGDVLRLAERGSA